MKANTTEYKRAFVEKNYARISVTIPKIQEERVKEYAQSVGESVNGLINVLLRSDMGMDEKEWKVPGLRDQNEAIAQSIIGDDILSAALFAKGIDLIKAHDPRLADAIMCREYVIPDKYIIAIAKFNLTGRDTLPEGDNAALRPGEEPPRVPKK